MESIKSNLKSTDYPTLARWSCSRVLGKGATATVYLAEKKPGSPEGLPPLGAVKVFHPHLDFSQRRFAAELEALKRLKSPYIVELVDHEIRDQDQSQMHAIVFEAIDGETLAELQKRLPYVVPEVSVAIVIDVLKALEAAHASGIIHRDLKPTNILVTRAGEIKVTDFGLAKLADQTLGTQTGSVLGSPEYMSPEQARGEVVDLRSDLFSVTSILYFLLTGTSAFSRPTLLASLSAVNEVQADSVQSRNPKVSLALGRLIQKGFSRDVLGRYQTATEYREALENYLAGLGLANMTLSSWMSDAHFQTVELLRSMAQALGKRAEAITKSATKGSGQNYQKPDRTEMEVIFQHLSIVAPSSQSLVGLSGVISLHSSGIGRRSLGAVREFSGLGTDKRRGRVVILLLLFMVGIGTFLFKKFGPPFGAANETVGTEVVSNETGETNPSTASLDTASALESETVVSPAPQVGGKNPTAGNEVSDVLPNTDSTNEVKKAANKTNPNTTPSDNRSSRLGTVRFFVSPDIQVKWNGEWVNPKIPLRVKPGVYPLVLWKKNHTPIRQNITVSLREPTVIRVGEYDPNGDEAKE